MSEETEKLRAIYQLLYELATGRRPMNLDKATIHSDAYDELYKSLHDLGLSLRTLILTSGAVPPYAVFEHLSAYVLVLDTSYRMIDFNANVTERLGYTPMAIRYQMFDSLLTNDSALEFHKQMNIQSDLSRFFVVVDLVFVAANGTHLPLSCTITNAFFEDWVFVVSVEVFLEEPHDLGIYTDAINSYPVIIEQLHTYILAHLDEALPSVKALARRFGIEEHTLRQAFKAHYGTSIYQFYQDARLKKGYQLILHTRLQLKEIAYQCGFGSYINFYKAFKKKFGMAPSSLLRPE